MGTKENTLDDYIRVGTEYYRKVKQPLKNDCIEALVRWKKETIKDDFETKDFKPIFQIKKYTGFCFIPGHGEDYKSEINGFYNQYEKLTWEPKEGSCDKTIGFLEHIFGEQFALGMDYLALLYLKPDHILPILCLVSEERNTGKSTFIKWLKTIFQGNMTINSNEEFRARFNSDWINKLIIGVEETLLEKKEDSERIKALSTGEVAKIERKNIDKSETQFYGKFILCSNNEDSFIRIDREEIRYWVRRINVPDTDNTNLLDEIISEIPAFLNHICEQGIKSQKQSRMWFHPDEISTEALDVLKSGNKSALEKEIETIVLEKMNDFEEDEIKMTLGDLRDELKHLRVSQSYITQVLQKTFRIFPRKNPSTYKAYHWSDSPSGGPMIKGYTDRQGRYYTFFRSMFDKSYLHNSKNLIDNEMKVIRNKAS